MKKTPTQSLTIVVAHMDALDRITDQVLAYRPKDKRKKPRKRKRPKKGKKNG